MALQQQTVNAFRKSRWICCPGTAEKINFYTVYRTVFCCDDITHAILLRVAVSGNQATFINGKLADFGQYTDFPQYKKFNERDISRFCKTGENTLEIAVYFSGNTFTSHYDGTPGLIAEIVNSSGTVLAASSENWQCGPDLRYAEGKMPTLSGSLNYTFDYDATKSVRYDRFAQKTENSAIMAKRDVPQVECRTLFCGKTIGHGDGCTVYDLGREVAGLLTLEISSEADHTPIQIVHGEYLTDGRVRDSFHARTFVDHYHCRAGRQTFVHYFRRFAARYLEIRHPDSVIIHTAGIHETPPDLPDLPEFYCNDDFFTKAYAVSAETLRLCMHEKYENCPWREQSICEYDARNQMLFGYPLWGNQIRAKAMLELYAQSVRPSGFLPAAVPSATNLVIPAYAFPWMTAIQEYTLYTGDPAEELFSAARAALKKILSCQKDGLYIYPEDEAHLWNYCEAPSLEYMPFPPNAFYQLYLHEALMAMGEKETAEKLGTRAVEYFFDETRGLFADHINDKNEKETFHGHIQMLFLERGLVRDDALRQKIFDAFRAETLETPALGALPYLIRAMFQYGGTAERSYIHDKLKRHYGIMLDAGAQTWWEVINGKDYGAGAGSLCHGWSAAIVYYIHAFLLGVTPLEAGYKTFRFKPYAGTGVTEISGSIWTPHGYIKVCWQKQDDGIHAQLTVPAGCTPVVESYPEMPVTHIERKDS